MLGRTRFPRDRRAAVPADARGPRLLLVPADQGGSEHERPRTDARAGARGGAASSSSASSAGSARSRASSSALRDRRQRRAAGTTRRGSLDALVEMRYGARHARPLPARARRRRGRAARRDRPRRRRTLRGGRPTRSSPASSSTSSAAARSLPAADGTIEFCALAALTARGARRSATCARSALEQSNSSVVVDDELIVKVYRRLEAGREPRARAAALLRRARLRARAASSRGWWSYSGRAAARVARDRAAVRRRAPSTAGRSRSSEIAARPGDVHRPRRPARRGARRDARRARVATRPTRPSRPRRRARSRWRC